MTDKQTDKAEKATPAAVPQAPTIIQVESEDARRSKALAEAQAEAVRLQMDETVVGGKYKVGDQWVDANGKPLKGED